MLSKYWKKRARLATNRPLKIERRKNTAERQKERPWQQTKNTECSSFWKEQQIL